LVLNPLYFLALFSFPLVSFLLFCGFLFFPGISSFPFFPFFPLFFLQGKKREKEFKGKIKETNKKKK
jgi:hypothetical protein